MFQPVKIAPSILSADFMALGRDVALIEEAGAGYVHVDVMDGHFVPNLTIGVPVLRQLSETVGIPCDVHLMISNTAEQVPWYLKAGAHSITVHAETLESDELLRCLRTIREGGAKAAVSIKPKTPVSVLEPVIGEADMVLVMSVEPGFSGQSYIEGSEDKVAAVAALARERGVAPLIEVDGGIDARTAPLVAACGADVLVCGNAVFGAEDPAEALRSVQRAAERARLAALDGGER